MSALAGLIGGAGGQAAQYGQQVRGLLEQRREHFAELLTTLAMQSPDLQQRAELLGHARDAYAGKPIEKWLMPAIKTVSDHVQGDQTLAQATGGVPQAPPPKPGPGNPQTGTAAQPSLSPVQPQAQTGAPQNMMAGMIGQPATPTLPAQPVEQDQIPSTAALGNLPPVLPELSHQPTAAPAQTGPTSTQSLLDELQYPQELRPQDPQAIMDKYHQRRMNATPVEYPSINAAEQTEVAHNEALRQKQEEMLSTVALGKARIHALQSPEAKQMADELRAQGYSPMLIPNMVASAFGMNMGAMGVARMVAETSRKVDVSQLTPEQKSQYGIPQNATGNWEYDMDIQHNPTGQARPTVAAYMPIAGANGELTFLNRNQPSAPGQAAAGGGFPAPAFNRPVDITDPFGRKSFQTAYRAQHGLSPFGPAGVNSSMATVQHVTEPTESGGHVETTTKVMPGTQSVIPSTGKPTAARYFESPTQHLAGASRPFDPQNTVDHLVEQIGNGDLHLTNVQPIKIRTEVQSRMAELGVTQANITGQMRDRAQIARSILGHMDEITGIINQAEKDGDLGLVATRWNDFLSGKLGIDPTKTKVFSKLATHLDFLQSAVAMAHGGLRAASSPTTLTHWEEALSAADPETLKSKLGAARSWVKQYSMFDQGLKREGAAPGDIPPVGAGVSLEELLKRHAH